MTDDPFRTAQLPPAEARRALRRALDFAERDASLTTDSASVARADLDRVGEQIGLTHAAITRGLSAENDEEEGAVPQKVSGLLGAPTRIVFEREFQGEPSTEDREDLVEMMRSEFGQTGSLAMLGKTFTWKPDTDYQGRGRAFAVRMRSRDGRTTVSVEESLTRPSIGLFVGLGLGGGIGPMGGYIALIAKIGVMGLVAPLVWIPLMLLLARTIFGALAARRRRNAQRIFRRICDTASTWSAPARRVRVAAGSTDEPSSSTTGDDEARAEEEAADAESRRSAKA